MHLEYQNTKVSLNVYRAILRPGLYLSETAPCAKVHSSNIQTVHWQCLSLTDSLTD